MLQRLTFRLFIYLFFNDETDAQAFNLSHFYLNYLHSFVLAKFNKLFKFGIFPTKQNKEQNIININFHSFKGYNSVK